jgi:hypothetical protein
MCLLCHSGLSDEAVLKEFKEVNESANIEFGRWNTTSISHLQLTGIGLNGQEARNEAISVLEKFIVWRRTKPANYIPETGLEPMPTVDKLNTMLTSLKAYTPNYNDRHSNLENYTNK